MMLSSEYSIGFFPSRQFIYKDICLIISSEVKLGKVDFKRLMEDNDIDHDEGE